MLIFGCLYLQPWIDYFPLRVADAAERCEGEAEAWFRYSNEEQDHGGDGSRGWWVQVAFVKNLTLPFAKLFSSFHQSCLQCVWDLRNCPSIILHGSL